MTIAGEPGIGKTTLASTFIKPGFIKFEDGTRSILGKDFIETDLLTSYDQGLEAIKAATESPDIKTIVVDSLSHLEKCIENEIVAGTPNAIAINQAAGGYGNGQKAVGSRMGEFKKRCDESGKNVIYLCQTEVEEMKTIDIEGFNRLVLSLNKHSRRHFTDLVDCVAFIRLKLYDQRKGKEKVVLSTHERELICYAHATLGSKNRFGITEPLDCEVDTNPIVEFIKSQIKKGK